MESTEMALIKAQLGLKRPREADGEGVIHLSTRVPRLSETCSVSTCTSDAREVERIHSGLPVLPGSEVPHQVDTDGLAADCGTRSLDVTSQFGNAYEVSPGVTKQLPTDAQFPRTCPTRPRPSALGVGVKAQLLEQKVLADVPVRVPFSEGCTTVPLSASAMTLPALQEQLELVLRDEQALLAELRLLRCEYDARLASLLNGAVEPKHASPSEPKEQPGSAPAAAPQRYAPLASSLPLAVPPELRQQGQLHLQHAQQQMPLWAQRQREQQRQQDYRPQRPAAPLPRPPPLSAAAARSSMPPPAAVPPPRGVHPKASRHGNITIMPRAQPVPVGQWTPPAERGSHRRVQFPLDVSQAHAASAPVPGKAALLPRPRQAPGGHAELRAPAANPRDGRGDMRVNTAEVAGPHGGMRASAADFATPQGRALLESHLLPLLLLQQQMQAQAQNVA